VGRIIVYNSRLRRLGSTSKAFDVQKLEELMREYTLQFSIVNTDSVFQYISDDSVFEFQGQKFDISGVDGESGKNNVTQISAQHISYRLADYTLPNGYSFVGTLDEIANDILNEARLVDGRPASSLFKIGQTADIGTTSYSTGDENNVTARQALIGLSKLGVEVSFDNFTVNIPDRVGKDSGFVFKYGKNLSGVHRTWQRDNGWSYEIDIVDLQKQPEYSGETFSLGDTVTVWDEYQNLILKNQQVISYLECDDPRQNKITLGVFVRDNATFAIETDSLAKSANDMASNSVQQGRKYSNVAITHEDGVIATNQAGTQRVIMNAHDCFAVQIKKGDEWVTVNSVAEFGMLTPRLTTENAMNAYYATIGLNESGNPGLFLYIKYKNAWIRHCEIWPGYDSEGNLASTFVDSKYGDLVLSSQKNIAFMTAEDGQFIFQKGNSGIGNTGTIQVGDAKLSFENGIFTGEEYEDVWSGTVPLANGVTMVFENGILKDVKGG